jgi:hypothetical protein
MRPAHPGLKPRAQDSKPAEAGLVDLINQAWFTRLTVFSQAL